MFEHNLDRIRRYENELQLLNLSITKLDIKSPAYERTLKDIDVKLGLIEHELKLIQIKTRKAHDQYSSFASKTSK